MNGSGGGEENRDLPPRILLCGDTAISVEFGSAVDRRTNRRVHGLSRRMAAAHRAGILDLNPTYRSLFIRYDPRLCSFESLVLLVEELMIGDKGPDAFREGEIHEIPVAYGGEYGPDLEACAVWSGLAPERFVELHHAPVYDVCMIGFTPGFTYLGGLDEQLATPRLASPRKTVPPGSVGIADRQTGLYAVQSPGGWRLIGRTPLCLFDPARSDPFLIRAGDGVRFKPVTREEFESLRNH